MIEKNLPELFVKIEGTVSTNITEFKNGIDTYVGSINQELITDDNFAVAEVDIKHCRNIELKLVTAKEAALSQSVDIKNTMLMIDGLGANIRQVRLRLEKLVKQEKEARKEFIVDSAEDALSFNIRYSNTKLGDFSLPSVDYTTILRESIKGMKSLKAMEGSVKIVCEEQFLINKEHTELMLRNIDFLNKAKDMGYDFLFKDFVQYVMDDNKTVAAIVTDRIADYRKVEEEKRARAIEKAIQEEAEKRARVEAEKKRKEEEAAQHAAAAKAVADEIAFQMKQKEEKTAAVKDLAEAFIGDTVEETCDIHTVSASNIINKALEESEPVVEKPVEETKPVELERTQEIVFSPGGNHIVILPVQKIEVISDERGGIRITQGAASIDMKLDTLRRICDYSPF